MEPSIRVAVESDVPALIGMAERFAAESRFGVAPDMGHLEQLLLSLLHRKDAIVLCSASGMLWGILSPLWYAPDTVVATELAWWVDPAKRNTGVGIRLLSRFEEWAWGAGAVGIQLAGHQLADGTAVPDGFFGRLGYTPVERCYLKML